MSKPVQPYKTQLALFGRETLNGSTGLSKLNLIQEAKQDCRECKLSAGRQCVVFGAGKVLRPTLAVIYGPPEPTDDVMGEPMQNERLAKQLHRILDFLEVPIEDTFILPVVGCKARTSQLTAREVQACAPLLLGQLRAVLPKIILCFGVWPGVSTLNLYKKKVEQVAAMYGEWQVFDDEVPTMISYPLEALLGRNSKGIEVAMEEHLRRVQRKLQL